MALALINRAPAAKRSCEGTPLGVTKVDMEKFGPPKVVLGSIPALCANRTVCLQSPAHDYSLTQFSGSHGHGE